MHTTLKLRPTCLEVKQHTSDNFTSIGETEGSRQRWEYIGLVLRHCLCLVTFRRIAVHSYNVIIHDINIRRFQFVDNFSPFPSEESCTTSHRFIFFIQVLNTQQAEQNTGLNGVRRKMLVHWTHPALESLLYLASIGSDQKSLQALNQEFICYQLELGK